MTKARFGAALGAFIALAAIPASAQMSARMGTFEGKSNHVTTGGAIVVQGGGQYIVRLMKDFSLDGAPDAVVGLGKDGVYDETTFLGELSDIKGSQMYPIPAGIDSEAYNEVYIWCRKFAVPLGVAVLNAGPNQ